MSTSPTPAEVGYPLHIRNEVIGKEYRSSRVSLIAPGILNGGFETAGGGGAGASTGIGARSPKPEPVV